MKYTRSSMKLILELVIMFNLMAFMVVQTSGQTNNQVSVESGVPFDISTMDISPAYPWTESDWEKQYPPEIPANRDSVEWKNIKLSNGVYDFVLGEFGTIENVCIYARVVLEADADCKVHLSMGSDDGIAVLVNGVKVFKNNVMRPMTPNQDQTDIKLSKGRNEILFRVTQGGGGMQLQVKATVLGNAKVTQISAAKQHETKASDSTPSH